MFIIQVELSARFRLASTLIVFILSNMLSKIFITFSVDSRRPSWPDNNKFYWKQIVRPNLRATCRASLTTNFRPFPADPLSRVSNIVHINNVLVLFSELFISRRIDCEWSGTITSFIDWCWLFVLIPSSSCHWLTFSSFLKINYTMVDLFVSQLRVMTSGCIVLLHKAWWPSVIILTSSTVRCRANVFFASCSAHQCRFKLYIYISQSRSFRKRTLARNKPPPRAHSGPSSLQALHKQDTCSTCDRRLSSVNFICQSHFVCT